MSSDKNSDAELLIEIQTRLEFQDRTIAELNDVITDHQRQLDQLNLRLEMLDDKLTNLDEVTDSPLGNEKPPHY